MIVEQNGTANKDQCAVTASKVSEIMIPTQNEQQNLQFSNFEINSFGA